MRRSGGEPGRDTGPGDVGSVVDPHVNGLVVGKRAVIGRDVRLGAGVGAVAAAAAADGERHAEAFATGGKSGTVANGVGSVEKTEVRVAGTGRTGVVSGISRGRLVGGGGLVLLGRIARSTSRSGGCVAGSLGSLPGLFLFGVGADPRSGRSAVVGEVVLNGGCGPFGNELHA